jgi:hypothetical protein
MVDHCIMLVRSMILFLFKEVKDGSKETRTGM